MATIPAILIVVLGTDFTIQTGKNIINIGNEFITKQNLLGKHILVFGKKMSHRLNRHIEAEIDGGGAAAAAAAATIIQIITTWSRCRRIIVKVVGVSSVGGHNHARATEISFQRAASDSSLTK